MPLDHYVPQVHLRHFCLPETGRLLAIRKSDGATFEPRTRDVCRIEDGNTNSFLREDRLIEEFLAAIEPKYNGALDGLLRQEMPQEAIFAIAGFASCVYACSPTGMRILTPHMTELLEVTAELADKHGRFGKPPPQLGGESLTELLRSKKVRFKVDPKYPQAVSIAGVLEYVRTFGNSDWEILRNPPRDSPFLSSDFPFALEETGADILNRIVPLTPELAIRIIPRYEAGRDKYKFDLRFPGFQCRRRTVRRAEVAHVNRLIVRCAEDLVFACGRRDWLEPFVTRNSRYRLDTRVRRVPKRGGGTYLVARQCIVLDRT